MTRLSQLPGPGDFRIPDPECARTVVDVMDDPLGIWDTVEWCDTHDQPWHECGGMEPDYDDEPVNP